VQITPLAKLQIQASSDGAAATQHDINSGVTFDADARLELTLGNLAKIMVEGGNPETRAEARALRATWDREVEPLLLAAGVKSVTELESARADADEAQRRVAILRKDISWNQNQIDTKAPLAAEVSRLEQEVDELSAKLAPFDEHAMVTRAKAHKSLATERGAAAIRASIGAQKEECQKLQVRLAEHQAGLSGKREGREKIAADIAAKARQLDAPWEEALTAADASLSSYKRQRDSFATQLAAVEKEGETELATAQKELEEAKKTRAAADGAQRKVIQLLADATANLNRCEGEVASGQPTRNSADLAQAEKDVHRLRKERADLTQGMPPITLDELELKRRQVKELATAAQETRRKLSNQEDALRHVGGDIANERYKSYSDAMQQKQNEESEVKVEYEAWQMLLNTLREVENDQAAHLGSAIVDSVAKRFGELTDSRYGAMRLGPNLETQGIVAQGDTREVGRLSVGTREQLSTILRFTLAEQLGSVLVLDDQLTQSDPQRIDWFREQFRLLARETQIIVMTCRPLDYLSTREMPKEKEYADSSDSLVRAVNLSLLVNRDQQE
jgi:chromosome segregation ATPase